jgi:small subunit ribosomal protein S2
LIKEQAIRCNSPFVCERWLGGTLTNLQTIRKSVKTFQAIEKKKIDGTYEKLTKKERLTNDNELEKLTLALGGIRDMRKLPGAMFVVDIRNEEIAVAEATRLGIPVIGLVDTNSDPTAVKYPIPANDDAFKSIWLIMKAIADAALEGQAIWAEKAKANELMTGESESSDEKHREQSRDRDHRGRGPRRRDRADRPAADKGAEAAE